MPGYEFSEGTSASRSSRPRPKRRRNTTSSVAEKTKKGYTLAGAAAERPAAAQHARDAKLEAAIDNDPDDPDVYLVDGDWLQAHGHDAASSSRCSTPPTAPRTSCSTRTPHFWGKVADCRDLLEPQTAQEADRRRRHEVGVVSVSIASRNNFDCSSMHDGKREELRCCRRLAARRARRAVRARADRRHHRLRGERLRRGVPPRRLASARCRPCVSSTSATSRRRTPSSTGATPATSRRFLQGVPEPRSAEPPRGSMKLGNILDLPELRELRVINRRARQRLVRGAVAGARERCRSSSAATT